MEMQQILEMLADIETSQAKVNADRQKRTPTGKPTEKKGNKT
jgi:hypothetical protein